MEINEKLKYSNSYKLFIFLGILIKEHNKDFSKIMLISSSKLNKNKVRKNK